MSTHTIFYSWQSDLPNKTNRGFILKALENVATSIRKDASIELEPVIDRNTLDVPGSPNIAATILSKIDQAHIFVCDVSTINKDTGSRPSPNPNVLFELGYAVARLSSERIVLVLNSAFGSVEDLPFDLRMHRTLRYLLAPDSENQATVRSKLESDLDRAVRFILLQIDKQKGNNAFERTSIQQMISQEIDYNLSCLREIYGKVSEEQDRYQATFRTGELGEWYSEGNPIGALANFHPSIMSFTVWEQQISSAALELTREEVADVFIFYGNLKNIIAAQEKFRQWLNSKGDPATYLLIAGERLDEVMKRIAITLENHPMLS